MQLIFPSLAFLLVVLGSICLGLAIRHDLRLQRSSGPQSDTQQVFRLAEPAYAAESAFAAEQYAPARRSGRP